MTQFSILAPDALIIAERRLAAALTAPWIICVEPLLRDWRGAGQPARLDPARAEALLRRVDRLAALPHTGRGLGDQMGRVLADVAALGVGTLQFAERRTTRADELAYRAAARLLLPKQLRDAATKVRAAISAGLRGGLTDAEIAERLLKRGVTEVAAHAATIARTEVTRFYTVGRLTAGEAAGDRVWGYRYVVIVDDRTTPICESLAGQVVSKTDLELVPPLHWNCRTTLVAVRSEPPGYKGPPLPAEPPQEGFGANPFKSRLAF